MVSAFEWRMQGKACVLDFVVKRAPSKSSARRAVTKKTKKPKQQPATVKVPLGVFGEHLFNDAKEYLRAAEILVHSSDVDAPKYFLLSHALELTLKAHLVAQGIGVNELRKLNHDIKKAHKKAAALGLQLGEDVIALFQEMVVIFFPSIG